MIESISTVSDIILPRSENGEFYISYSQYSTWKSSPSFNLGIEGRQEYILSYFFGTQFESAGWSEFGKEVEDYICEKKGAELFDPDERITLDRIKPLGVFQQEVKLELLPGVFLKGYMDDATSDFSHIRDYKTASANSKTKYYKDDYYQLDIYSAWVLQETGRIPKKIEVCIIERKGNCFGKVNRRDLLKVGNEVWYHDRDTSIGRINKVKQDLIEVIYEISAAYKVFLKTNV